MQLVIYCTPLGYDEPDATVFGHLDDGRKTDTEPTQGVTLKTGTGKLYLSHVRLDPTHLNSHSRNA